jgi:hypothetical protein
MDIMAERDPMAELSKHTHIWADRGTAVARTRAVAARTHTPSARRARHEREGAKR